MIVWIGGTTLTVAAPEGPSGVVAVTSRGPTSAEEATTNVVDAIVVLPTVELKTATLPTVIPLPASIVIPSANLLPSSVTGVVLPCSRNTGRTEVMTGRLIETE